MTIEYMKTREAYGQALVELGKENQDLVVLEADIAKSTRTELFAKEFPDRFFQMGIAEQNEFGVAAGMAMSGKIPMVSTYAVFASMRALEQIRSFMAYPNLNVKIAVSHGGLTPGSDGPTHQAIEDMAIMRAIPNMTVIMPTDGIMTKKAVAAGLKHNGLVYLRLTRDPVPVIYDDSLNFQIGQSYQHKDGIDLTLISIGDMLYFTLKAATLLEKENISARVIDMPTLKTLDEKAVLKAAEETGALVTVEDHTILGGLGSAVSEVLVEQKPVPLKRVGIRDTFAESGPYQDLLDKYGLSTQAIIHAAHDVLARKK